MWKRDTIGIIDINRNVAADPTELTINMQTPATSAAGALNGPQAIITAAITSTRGMSGTAAYLTADTTTAAIILCPHITQLMHAAQRP
jgi:hypothetical protein